MRVNLNLEQSSWTEGEYVDRFCLAGSGVVLVT